MKNKSQHYDPVTVKIVSNFDFYLNIEKKITKINNRDCENKFLSMKI